MDDEPHRTSKTGPFASTARGVQTLLVLAIVIACVCRVRLLNEREVPVILQCGDDREYPWGSEWPPPAGWNYNSEESVGPRPRIADRRDKWPAACPVDESGRNDWGLHGVGDNVMEWTAARGVLKEGRAHGPDWYDLLGASWYFGRKDHLRCDYRSVLRSKYAPCYVGFRLVIGR